MGNTDVRRAYARIGSKRSVYSNYQCTSSSISMHEFGHNIRLYHSNQDGVEYGDLTDIMGYTEQSQKEPPRKCFNGAKSWLLGWYSEKSTSINIRPSDPEIFDLNLISPTSYEIVTAQDGFSVLVEISTGESDDDGVSSNYYLMYNLQDSFNSGVGAFADMVTITKGYIRELNQGLRETRPSEHVAHLAVGQVFKIENYKESEFDLIIKFCAENRQGNPPHARLVIYLATPDIDLDMYTCDSIPPTSAPIIPATPLPQPSDCFNKVRRAGLNSLISIFQHLSK